MAQKEKRLPANAPGDFYVDETCIDCDTCRWMAPGVFDEANGQSRVHRQPENAGDTAAALQALVSCPTASIGTIQRHDLVPIIHSFPIAVTGPVFHCGYHDESSFGATSYFVKRPEGNLLVDTPRFTRPLVKRLEELGGVKMLLLTHRDDVGDHEKFRNHFGCDRVLHRADVSSSTRSVEIQPEGGDAQSIAEGLLMIPVPGHTRGSACLLFGPYLFTGDHLAFDPDDKGLVAWRSVCWYDWTAQTRSMERLAKYSFEWVLPGHGRRVHFPADEMAHQMEELLQRMGK